MHAFARETQLSETSFLQSPEADGADYRHRIWMVRGEIPFAGHPSLGAAVAYVRAAGESSATVVQQTGAGLQPIDVEVADRTAHASMLQEPLELGELLDPEATFALLGLDPSDADPALPPRVAATGVPQLLVPVRERAALGRLRAPADDLLAPLIDGHGAVVLYVAWVEGERAAARSFFPGGEDPATGAAVGPLCAYVHACTGVTRLLIEQGTEIGRPSRLEAAIEGDRVRVGGDAVVVLDGTVALDA
jgi:trans-2,3-dihydro-3-hydroxyanthranilate isomerase